MILHLWFSLLSWKRNRVQYRDMFKIERACRPICICLCLFVFFFVFVKGNLMWRDWRSIPVSNLMTGGSQANPQLFQKVEEEVKRTQIPILREMCTCRDGKSMPVSNFGVGRQWSKPAIVVSEECVYWRISHNYNTTCLYCPLICWFKGETIAESRRLFDLRSYIECVAMFLFFYC